MEGDTLLRHEIKFSLPDVYSGEIKSWVFQNSNAFFRLFPPRQINNIYFDTYERDCMNDHLSGVFQRAKYRYRWYGQSWITDKGHFEIKYKQGRLGGKENIPLDIAMDLQTQTWQEVFHSLGRENLKVSNSLLGMKPVLINHYWREYFSSANKLLRITMDTKLVSYDQSFGTSPNITHPTPQEGSIVIEVKASVGQEEQISAAISELPLYAVQNSKFLKGVM